LKTVTVVKVIVEICVDSAGSVQKLSPDGRSDKSPFDQRQKTGVCQVELAEDLPRDLTASGPPPC